MLELTYSNKSEIPAGFENCYEDKKEGGVSLTTTGFKTYQEQATAATKTQHDKVNEFRVSNVDLMKKNKEFQDMLNHAKTETDKNNTSAKSDKEQTTARILKLEESLLASEKRGKESAIQTSVLGAIASMKSVKKEASSYLLKDVIGGFDISDAGQVIYNDAGVPQSVEDWASSYEKSGKISPLFLEKSSGGDANPGNGGKSNLPTMTKEEYRNQSRKDPELSKKVLNNEILVKG